MEAVSSRCTSAPRGITRTGTGELRMILVEFEPRKTRATGPSWLDPITSTSPSSHGSESSASSQSRPLTTPASTTTLPDSVASALSCASSACARHCSSTRRSASYPTCEGYICLSRTTKVVSRSGTPCRLLSCTAASNALRDCVDPANAQVTRRSRASEDGRYPLGASATGTGDTCSISLAIPPTVIRPRGPCRAEPRATSAASVSVAVAMSPSDADEVEVYSALTVSSRKSRASAIASSAYWLRNAAYSASTRAGDG